MSPNTNWDGSSDPRGQRQIRVRRLLLESTGHVVFVAEQPERLARLLHILRHVTAFAVPVSPQLPGVAIKCIDCLGKIFRPQKRHTAFLRLRFQVSGLSQPQVLQRKARAAHTFHEITNYYPMRVIRTKRYKFIWNIAWKLDYSFASDLWYSASWQAVVRDGVSHFGTRSVDAYLHRDRFELYDVIEDPDEVVNLAHKPEYAALVEEFGAKIRRFQRETQDPWEHKWIYE